jgi:hypothetical protein
VAAARGLVQLVRVAPGAVKSSAPPSLAVSLQGLTENEPLRESTLQREKPSRLLRIEFRPVEIVNRLWNPLVAQAGRQQPQAAIL